MLISIKRRGFIMTATATRLLPRNPLNLSPSGTRASKQLACGEAKKKVVARVRPRQLFDSRNDGAI